MESRIKYDHKPQKQSASSLQHLIKPAGLLLILILAFCSHLLGADNRSEEYLSVKNWRVPQDAVTAEELTQEDGLQLYRGEPFTGVSYSTYPDGQLMRAVSYAQGRQDGLMLLWYPDGAPQMSASYQNGALHGRFLGWYLHGGMIYDMMINRGTYAGDILAEGDDSRSAVEGADFEREGPDNDQSPE